LLQVWFLQHIWLTQLQHFLELRPMRLMCQPSHMPLLQQQQARGWLVHRQQQLQGQEHLPSLLCVLQHHLQLLLSLTCCRVPLEMCR